MSYHSDISSEGMHIHTINASIVNASTVFYENSCTINASITNASVYNCCITNTSILYADIVTCSITNASLYSVCTTNASITYLSLWNPITSSLSTLPTSWCHVGNNITCSLLAPLNVLSASNWVSPSNTSVTIDVPGVYMCDAVWTVSYTSANCVSIGISSSTSYLDDYTHGASFYDTNEGINKNVMTQYKMTRFINKQTSTPDLYCPIIQTTTNCSLATNGTLFHCVRLA